MPHTIFIEFENYTGPTFFPCDDPRHKWIPISPSSIYNQNVGGTRTQFPLRYASTIHKSQGQTLDKVVIDLGTTEKSLGLTFVALSRVRNYKDFLIVPFTRDRLEKISKSTQLEPRLKEEKSIQNFVTNTLRKYTNLN